jgi:heterodisulfide reductase subunit A
MTRDESVLIVGGGIAGFQAALDLAAAGVQVHMVEKSPSIGGRMAQLDKTFPTNDCAICILAPKMIETYGHKNIHVRTYAEVQRVEGSVGNFKVEILQKARFVHADKCTGCGACMEKCPKKVPSEYEMGLADRRAIYFPFAQAVPRVATIDKDSCIYFKTGKCKICVKTCQVGAIDHDMKDEVVTVNVGAIIVATGFDVYMPHELEEYGYGRYDNVVTAMQFERIINAAGPTHGHLQRLSEDKGRPKRLGFIQCVGARDVRGDRPYCCAVCCMHSTKEAMLAREHHADTQSWVFYTDMRAFGKGFWEYVERGERDYGINYIRGKPGEIVEDPATKNLVLYYTDREARQVRSLEVDMVILATALIPRKDAPRVAEVLGIEQDRYGFFLAPDEMMPMDTTREGVYMAGYCQKPMDIPDAVAQGSAAAARAMEAIAQHPGSGRGKDGDVREATT